MRLLQDTIAIKLTKPAQRARIELPNDEQQDFTPVPFETTLPNRGRAARAHNARKEVVEVKVASSHPHN
jgi:hypothetical protein